VKIEAAVAALTVTAVETIALVVAVATADGDGDGSQNRVARKVSCNKEDGGNDGKSDGNKGGGRAMATAMTWAVAMAMRLAGDKEGKRKGGKSIATATRADGDGDSRWSRFSGGSSGNNQYGGGKQQQKLRGQATINKMGQVAAVKAETAAVSVAIVAARLQWQVGARWSRCIQIPSFLLAWRWGRGDGSSVAGEVGNVEPKNLSVKSTLISESPSTVPRGPPTCTYKCEIYT
jgi:hypothetical protein